jgi:membrane protein implicated in regulation of membrane protease activity
VSGLFSQISAFGVFLAIAGAGFLYLLFTLIFGEIFEHLDHDFDHGGPSFFSGKVLGVFVTAFGATGAGATHYGLSVPAASGAGLASGIVFGGVIFFFARFLYSQQATTQVTSADMVGCSARVVVAIPSSGVGQVRCQVGEEIVDKVARSEDGEPIAANSIVRIEQVLGEVVIVKPR